MAVVSARAALMLPVALKVPDAGSYNSADSSLFELPLTPPTTSTFPLGSSAAACSIRPMAMLLVELHVPVAWL